MTALLQQAFAKASQLPDKEQEVLAARLLAELAPEDEFDQRIAATSSQLEGLAREAISEHRSGTTQQLDPEQL
jgi:hypothetical protein